MVATFDSRTTLQISFTKLKKIFSQHSIAVASKYPVITIYKMKPIDLTAIRANLEDLFLRQYDGLTIQNLHITPQSFIDIESEAFEKIDIGSNALKKNKGSFAAWFSNKKRIFFAYELEATIEAYRATKTIEGGTVISSFNAAAQSVAFELLNDRPIRSNELGSISAKGRIAKGDIITLNRTMKVPDLMRGRSIRVELREGGVKLSFYAKALKDAYVGQLVDVKDSGGKTYRVRLVEKDLARIE